MSIFQALNPVFFHVSYSMLGIFMLLILGLYMSPLWQCVVIILSFVPIFFVIGRPAKRKQVLKHSTKKKCRICHLSYDLVIKCCFQNYQCPSQLDGSTLPYPICNNNQCWRRSISRVKSKVKNHMWIIIVVYHDFFFIHNIDSYYSFRLDSGMHNTTLSWFCDS